MSATNSNYESYPEDIRRHPGRHPDSRRRRPPPHLDYSRPDIPAEPAIPFVEWSAMMDLEKGLEQPPEHKRAPDGEFVRFQCPLANQRHVGGEDLARTAWINVGTGHWGCHVCLAGGATSELRRALVARHGGARDDDDAANDPATLVHSVNFTRSGRAGGRPRPSRTEFPISIHSDLARKHDRSKMPGRRRFDMHSNRIGQRYHTHWYRDPEGNPYVCALRPRHRSPGEPKLLWTYNDNGKWYWGVGAHDRPIRPHFYRRELLSMSERKDWTVIWVEGELCADALNVHFELLRNDAQTLPDHLKVMAFTSAGGPNAWRQYGPDDWAVLMDRDVIIWPDHDDEGYGYGRCVAGRLRGIARNMWFVLTTLADVKPPLAPGWDCADALAEGVSPTRFIADHAVPLVTTNTQAAAREAARKEAEAKRLPPGHPRPAGPR